MITEQRTIVVTAYRDAEGRPTCWEHRRIGKWCKMIKWDKGTAYCGWCENRLESLCTDGYLRPCENCPVWAGELK
jgi:hypothetical protein